MGSMAALFTTNDIKRNLLPSVGKQVKEEHGTGYYLALKREGILPLAATRMNLEDCEVE